MSYAEPAELRAQPDVRRDTPDEVLVALLSAASRAIDRICNRPDGFVALDVGEARLFWGTGRRHLLVGDFVELSLVEVRSGAWSPLTSTQPYSGSSEYPSDRRPYVGIMRTDGGTFTRDSIPTVRVTARWGYSDIVSPIIRQATIVTATRWWMRGRTAWSDATASPELGAVMYRQEVDPDVRMMLERSRFIRPAV